MSPFVPPDFHVPELLEADGFRLRMLTVHDVVKDYDAVMSSVEHLSTLWPGGTWPTGLTIEQNLVDLGWHQKEFQMRRSFAYTVVAPDESRVLGCVYIDPTTKRDYDAQVCLWARSSELEAGLEDRLLAAVEAWIENVWPFQRVGYPGRRVPWADWSALPDASPGRID